MKRRNPPHRRLVSRIHPLTAAIAATVGSSCVIAIEARAADDEIVDEIIVTASRRETTVQDIPFNIAAVGGEQLEEQRLTTLADIGRWVPGLTVIDQGGRAGNVMTVRGLNTDSLNATEFLDNSSGDVVGTYIGEIPLYLDLKLRDIERVEALLGPQGTLYGASTLGGAVRYIPRKPDLQEFTLDVHGQFYALAHAEDLGFDGDVVLNLPLMENRLALRALAGYLDDPGFIDYNYLVREPGVSNPQPDFSNPADVAANLEGVADANDEQTKYARALLLWQATDDVDATLGYYFQDQDVGARQMNHVAAFGTTEYESAYRFLEPNDRQNHLVSLEINVGEIELPLLGRARLTSATGYSVYHEVGQRDQTDLLLNFQYGYENFPAFAAFTREDADENRFNQELRLVSDNDSRWNWIAGVFYNNFDTDAVTQEFTPGLPEFFGVVRPDNLEYIQTTDDDLEEEAVFGEVGYQLTDQWQVTVGARYFEYKTDTNVCFDLPLLDGTPDSFSFSCEADDLDDDDFIFKFNTSYDWTDDVTTYLTISEGYRVGGVNAVPPCEDPLPPGQNVCALPEERFVKPDTTLNYEIGLHSTWLDGRLTFNGSVYYIDWDDVQLASFTANGLIPITLNGATAETYGTELALQAEIADNWSLNAAYAYDKAELTQDVPRAVTTRDDANTSLVLPAFSGDRLPGTPEHKASLFLRYQAPLSSGLDVSADYGLTAMSDVYTKVGLRGNGEELGGFTIHNAALSLSSDIWDVTLYADNLTDKFAVTGVRQDRAFIRDIGLFTLRRYHQDVLRPREIGVKFAYRFDL